METQNTMAEQSIDDIYERMAAWHETLVVVNETVPNSGVFTYCRDEDATVFGHYMLAKIVPYIKLDNEWYGPDQSRNLQVEDFPGGVTATFDIGRVKVMFEIAPLPVGRNSEEQEGAMIYRIQSVPAAPILLCCGDGAKVDMVGWRTRRINGEDIKLLKVIPRQQMAESTFLQSGDRCEIEEGTAYFTNSNIPLHVALEATGDLTIRPGANGGEHACVQMNTGEGEICIAYGADRVAANTILKLTAKTNRLQTVHDYYDHLLSARIETPDNVLDRAFRSAIYNLEYSWVHPYGWTESIHHWLSMWHMQHTLGADWLGQTDRSKACMGSQADRLDEAGAVPCLLPNGKTFRPFGGTNQFFAWQARHYWLFTGDLDFVKAIAPVLDRVIAQTYEEYDPEGDLLLAWREQIGNQEDYISHPHNSTAPSIEGINMIRTRIMFAHALGEEQQALHYESMLARAMKQLKEQLWQSDLGRFLYYKDPHQVPRMEGPYQTYIYPAIYEIVDDLDAWTSMRHVRDRLIGRNGELYASNLFPNHSTGTYGTQAGASQQPWGAMGLAAVGLRNETYLPLKDIAACVMGESMRGSWPEIATEHTPAYFSPPAAVYIQAVAEALFGLKVDIPSGTIEISPSFPDHWPEAKLFLPNYEMFYRRDNHILKVEINTETSLIRQIKWRLPVSKPEEVMVNGVPVDYVIQPGVNCVILIFETAASQTSTIKITVSPIEYEVIAPASIAEGDQLCVRLEGGRIGRFDDRCGVLDEVVIQNGTRLEGRIRRGLLRPYLVYGQLGLVNFSRRTFFILVNAGDGITFWHSIDLAVLPRCEAAQSGEMIIAGNGRQLSLLIRNNTNEEVKGECTLEVDGFRSAFSIELTKRSESRLNLLLPMNPNAPGPQGDIEGTILMPNGELLNLILAFPISSTQGRPLQYEAVPLPEASLIPADHWKALRNYYSIEHMPWLNADDLFKGVSPDVIPVDGLPFQFKSPGSRFVPLSFRSGTPSFTIQLKQVKYKKLFLLLLPLLDNHDTFSPVCQLTLTRRDDRMTGKTLYFPGDVDWFWPKEAVGYYATAVEERKNRLGLFPQLSVSETDWVDGKPKRDPLDPFGVKISSFPQKEYWSKSLPVQTPGSVMSVVQIELRHPAELKSLTLSSIGAEPAFGLVAVHAAIKESEE